MKLTKSKLKEMIEEELSKLEEANPIQWEVKFEKGSFVHKGKTIKYPPNSIVVNGRTSSEAAKNAALRIGIKGKDAHAVQIKSMKRLK